MKHCYLCRGEQVADLVRLKTETDVEKRMPVCNFHMAQLGRWIREGKTNMGNPTPEGWAIQQMTP